MGWYRLRLCGRVVLGKYSFSLPSFSAAAAWPETQSLDHLDLYTGCLPAHSSFRVGCPSGGNPCDRVFVRNAIFAVEQKSEGGSGAFSGSWNGSALRI